MSRSHWITSPGRRRSPNPDSRRRGTPWLAAAAVTLALTASAALAQVKPAEQVLFFPTAAAHASARGDWQVEIRGRIYEPERNRVTVQGLDALRRLFGLDGLNETEERTFRDRARLFLNESAEGKQVLVQVGKKLVRTARAGEGGLFTGRTIAPPDAGDPPAAGMPDRWVAARAVLRDTDKRGFGGVIQLVAPEGLSIVSDIDDTIKLTNVLDRREMARNTFARPFAPVSGMADLYTAWMKATPGIAFHYVSAGPWQLYEPLEKFRQSSGFPPGSFHLRELSLRKATSFGSPEATRAHKLAEIEALVRLFPQRRFVLVGDSGEQDPEIYGEIARRYPRNVERILIRNVTSETQQSERYRRAFEGVPAGNALVFSEPASVASALPTLPIR